MNIRRIAGISIVAAMASASITVVVAQDSDSLTVPENVSTAVGEYYQQQWAAFVRAGTGAQLRELIQSLEEFFISPPENAAAMEEWQQLLGDFQDASDRFVSLNQQTYAERADQVAAGAVAD